MVDKRNFIEDEYTLSKVSWIPITIEKDNMKTFKEFCERNRIPFEVMTSDTEEIAVSVRDGLDAKDVVSYMLRNTYGAGDRETSTIIHMLFQVRTCCVPKYEYELHTYRTKEDEWMLSHFDDSPTLEL